MSNGVIIAKLWEKLRLESRLKTTFTFTFVVVGACGEKGTCHDLPGGRGYRCACPVGSTGDRCESGFQITDPSFNRSSYIAYPTMEDSLMETTISMMIKVRENLCLTNWSVFNEIFSNQSSRLTKILTILILRMIILGYKNFPCILHPKSGWQWIHYFCFSLALYLMLYCCIILLVMMAMETSFPCHLLMDEWSSDTIVDQVYCTKHTSWGYFRNALSFTAEFRLTRWW